MFLEFAGRYISTMCVKICVDNVLRTQMNWIKENGFTLRKKKQQKKTETDDILQKL